jgi:hypothetical protein
MRKAFFLLAFILPVCSLLAQTNPTSLIPGTGDDNVSMIKSSIGNGNSASADQQGWDNLSIIRQLDADGNKAKVTQINHKDIPGTEDNFNYSKVKQTGDDNKAFVTQEHNGTSVHGLLEAYILQAGDDNKATQIQGPGNKTGSETVARIKQTGDDNVARQEQMGYKVTMTIRQYGDDGVAKQTQGNGVDRSQVKIYQADGTKDNKAYQTQTSGSSLEAVAMQTGSSNKSTQIQDGWVMLAKVKQSGNNNTARQEQDGKLNLALIKQESNGNIAKQNQSYDGDRLTGYHAANDAYILQTGGKENVAHQTQTVSTDNIDPDFVGNWGRIYQDGKFNEAYQTQDDGHNIGTVIQTGNSNVAHVSQSQSIL